MKLFFKLFIIPVISFSLFYFSNSSELKPKLGLDLQGGSYLLLEVDSEPLILQKLQNKLINLRKVLKDQNIKYQNFLNN